MKKIIATLLVLVLVLPLCLTPVVSLADDWDDMSDEDIEAFLGLMIGLAALDEEYSGSSSSSSNRSSSSSSSKAKSPSVPASTAPVTQVTPYNANVKTNGGVLNVRNRANKGATILTKLSNGSPLVVTGYTGQWLQVNANGVTGYVPSRYVTGSTGAAQTYSTQPVAGNVYNGGQYYVIVNPTNNFVNLRAQPSKESQILGVYYYGYQLKVLSENNGWCQVLDEATGKTGYIMQSLVQRINNGVASASEQG